MVAASARLVQNLPRMKRSAILLFLGSVAFLFLCTAGCSRRANRPNIVLVSIDTLRADHLKCYGYGRDTSPFLERLAREGVLFENVIVQSHWTLPSHVSMLTSLHAPAHGVRTEAERMGTGLLTMAEILKGAGYATAAFVDGGLISAQVGFDQGFDLFDDASRDREKEKRALRWVEKRRGRPFFLFYHTYDVHFPYHRHPARRPLADDPALEGIARRINDRQFDLSDEEWEKAVLAWCTTKEFYRMIARDRLETMKSEMDRFFKERWPRMPSFGESLRYLIDAYDGGITYFDGRLKKLWGRMGEMGLHRNTLLIVTSDHGEGFLEHGELGHPAVLYDEILRVPLIIAYPPLGRPGTRIARQVMSIDILPTVLDILKIPAPPEFQGSSLLPLIGKGSAGPPPPAFSDAVETEAVRTDAWKLIRAGEGSAAAAELYRLRDDPSEKENVAGREDASRKRLESLLDGWRAANEKLRARLGEAGAPGKARLEEATREQLRALGYLQ